jgi:hypothetical protein
MIAVLLSQIAVTTLGAGLLFLGVREAVAPRAGARGYGVPIAADTEPTPYLGVKANRDIALGALLILVAFTSSPGVIASTLGIATLCPAWDAALVLHYGRRQDSIVHLATAGYSMLVALLAIGGR